MALITLPAKFSFTDVGNLTLQRASNILRSRYTGQSQRILYPFAVWEFKGTLVDYDGPEAAAIRAFFVALEGTKHTFKLPVPGYSKPSIGSVVSVYPNEVALINIQPRASQTGSFSLAYSGTIISAGEYFTIGGELKIATNTVVADGGGVVAAPGITFQPPMRAAATLVNFNNPTCQMHAADDDVASWGIKAPNRHGLKLEAVEAVSI